jgi:hypothetical protein
MVVEMKQIFTKDRLERKKYMGVCRWESAIMTRMMSRFPSTVTRYMERKIPYTRTCSSGFCEIREEEILKFVYNFVITLLYVNNRKMERR